jgi:hypothetical protein
VIALECGKQRSIANSRARKKLPVVLPSGISLPPTCSMAFYTAHTANVMQCYYESDTAYAEGREKVGDRLRVRERMRRVHPPFVFIIFSSKNAASGPTTIVYCLRCALSVVPIAPGSSVETL